MLKNSSCCSPVLALLLSASLATAAETITGRSRVIDGDTIEIRGERIRLHGVDAPESWRGCEDGDGGIYRCGKEAAYALDSFVAPSRPIRCELVERTRYKRRVSICFRADGREVNRWLVESGNAADWPCCGKAGHLARKVRPAVRGARAVRAKRNASSC